MEIALKSITTPKQTEGSLKVQNLVFNTFFLEIDTKRGKSINNCYEIKVDPIHNSNWGLADALVCA